MIKRWCKFGIVSRCDNNLVIVQESVDNKRLTPYQGGASWFYAGFQQSSQLLSKRLCGFPVCPVPLNHLGIPMWLHSRQDLLLPVRLRIAIVALLE